MLVVTSQLSGPKTIIISGDEPWLKDIYERFSTVETLEKQEVVGTIELVPAGEGTRVDVKGSLQYQPVIPCHRCCEPLTWELSIEVRASFQGAPENHQPKVSSHQVESDGAIEHLDIYYFKDGDKIDIEELVNDHIHLALPNRLTCEENMGRICDLPEQPKTAEEKEQPFSALADWKLKN